jgi:hypothetical protein
MAQSSWMAKKFTRGMTYQSDRKDLEMEWNTYIGVLK